MSTKLRTGISPAFSDAVVAELRAAINNNAPINETVYSSLLPSQKPPGLNRAIWLVLSRPNVCGPPCLVCRTHVIGWLRKNQALW